MTVEEIKQYAQEFLSKNGMAPEKVSVIVETLGDPTAAKAFADGFVPRPDYSRDLDKTRDDWQAKYNSAMKPAQDVLNWYNSEVKPWWEKNQEKVTGYDRYQQTFGPLDDTTNKDDKARQTVTPANVVTKEDLAAFMSQRDEAYSSLLKLVPRLVSSHFRQFNEELDLDGLEKFAKDKNLSLDIAYQQMMQPKVEAAKEAQWQLKAKQMADEAVRDYATKHSLPVDTGPKPVSPVWDGKTVDKTIPGWKQDEIGQNAFMEGLHSTPPQTVNTNNQT